MNIIPGERPSASVLGFNLIAVEGDCLIVADTKMTGLSTQYPTGRLV